MTVDEIVEGIAYDLEFSDAYPDLFFVERGEGFVVGRDGAGRHFRISVEDLAPPEQAEGG